jgi:hypothetical protein
MTRFAQKLSKLTMLRKLKICSTRFDHVSSSALASIFENNEDLVSLIMRDCNIGITFRNENGQCVQDSTFLDGLCSFLLKNPQQLCTLDIDSNPIWSEGLTKISKSLSSNKSLIYISINNSLNNVSYKDVSTLDVCHQSRFKFEKQLDVDIEKLMITDGELKKDGYKGCLQGMIDMVTSINNNVDTVLKNLSLKCIDTVKFPSLYHDVSDVTNVLTNIPCYGTDDNYNILKYKLLYSKIQEPDIHTSANTLFPYDCVHYFYNVKDTRTVVNDNNNVESVVLTPEPRRKIKYESIIDLTDDNDDNNSASNSNEPSKKKSCH